MVFNSFTFLIFLGVVLALHSGPFSWKAKKWILLIASYLFYAAWNPPFVALLWISTVVDWFSARGIHNAKSRAGRIAFLWASLGTNLGLLAVFKYGNFLLLNFQALAATVGIQYVAPEWNIVLPVGISFYTFQTLSYTIDIYRRNMEPWDSPLDFALYVTFFPQLVAGPIVRASEFLPQCAQERRATREQMGWGFTLLVLGLFQKVVIADGLLAPIVERVYDADGVVPGFVGAWTGTLAFAGQIFCDFAGYSTCAIGVAMILGFALPYNFRFPYAARGFSDFWRRWHISLSSWLRDYLYIPLGGNRRGPTRTHVNLVLTMLLGGLWHGAAWTFVVWGGMHGTFLILEKVVLSLPIAGWKLWQRLSGQLTVAALTFVGICFTWVFFRANGFDSAFQLCAAMVGAENDPTLWVGVRHVIQVGVPVAGILLAHWLLRDTTLESAASKLPAMIFPPALAAMIIAILMMPGTDRAFIYFQF